MIEISAEDAKHEWISAALEDGIPIPAPHGIEDYSWQFKLRITRSLRKQLAERSKREGVSMNQYCLNLLSRNDARMAKWHVWTP